MGLIGRPNNQNYSRTRWKCLLQLVSYCHRKGGSGAVLAHPTTSLRVHFRIYPFIIMMEFTPRRVDQVILVGDLAKEISDTIQDVTIEEW